MDGEDRLTRKRIERAKEMMLAKLEALATAKDDMLTIGEIGVDQIIVDEAQEFRYAQDKVMYSSLPRMAWMCLATGIGHAANCT